jgi:hypothetical protein
MSWKSGGGIFYEIILTLKETVPDYQTRVEVYSKLIEIFKERDCDTLYECLDEDLAFDDAYFELHPDETIADTEESFDEEYEE